MKKFFVVILALVYFATSTGATISMHYCMGKLADWELGQESSKSCGFCGMDKMDDDNGCCKDEQKFLKNVSDQKNGASSFEVIKIISAVTLPGYGHLATVFISYLPLPVPMSNAPPRNKGQALFILNNTFLI